MAVTIDNKKAALDYLNALERANEISRFRFQSEFVEWWGKAGRAERLAMCDLLSSRNGPPLTTHVEAHARARMALAELHRDCEELRERYISKRFELPDAAGD
jgi:hypothetical protein